MPFPAAKRKWRREISAPASPAGAGDRLGGGHRGSESPFEGMSIIRPFRQIGDMHVVIDVLPKPCCRH